MTFCDPPQPHPLILWKLIPSPNPLSQFLWHKSPGLSSSVVNVALMHTTGHEELKEGGRHSKMQWAILKFHYPAQSHMLLGHWDLNSLCKFTPSLVFSLVELSPAILKRDDYFTLGIQQETLLLGLYQGQGSHRLFLTSLLLQLHHQVWGSPNNTRKYLA